MISLSRFTLSFVLISPLGFFISIVEAGFGCDSSEIGLLTKLAECAVGVAVGVDSSSGCCDPNKLAAIDIGFFAAVLLVALEPLDVDLPADAPVASFGLDLTLAGEPFFDVAFFLGGAFFAMVVL
jgi:hypothetical protein